MAVPQLRERARRLAIRRPVLQNGFLEAGSPIAGTPLPQVDVGRGDRLRKLDDLLGYQFALIASPGALRPVDLEWAAGRGIGVWRVGEDLDEPDGQLADWMEAKDSEFVLVRPDRIVFASGRAREMQRARDAFDRWTLAHDT